jgi:hypothetical protein
VRHQLHVEMQLQPPWDTSLTAQVGALVGVVAAAWVGGWGVEGWGGVSGWEKLQEPGHHAAMRGQERWWGALQASRSPADPPGGPPLRPAAIAVQL